MKKSFFYFFCTFIFSLGMALSVLAMPPKKRVTPQEGMEESAAEKKPTAAAPAAFDLSRSLLTHVTPIDPSNHDYTLKPGSFLPSFFNAGFAILYRPTLLEQAVRPCLYFCIDQVTRNREGLRDLDERDYGVVLPFASVSDRIMNCYPTDTAVWGPIDLRTTPGAVLFVPHREYIQGDSLGSLRIIPYSPGHKLSDVMTDFIREARGAALETRDSGAGKDDRFDKCFLEEVDIEPALRAHEIFHQRPYMSYGHEAAPFQRNGCMPHLHFLFNFHLDFMLSWKYKLPAPDIGRKKFLETRQAEAYLVTARFCVDHVRSVLANPNLESIKADFEKTYMPLLRTSIGNVDGYVEKNRSKPKVQNRIIDVARIMAVVSFSEPDAALRFLDHPVFAPAREELISIYWAHLWLDSVCHQIACPDDSFAKFQESVDVLRTKEPNWYRLLFLRLLNNQLESLEPSASYAKDHFSSFVKALDPLIPPKGMYTMSSSDKPQPTLCLLEEFQKYGSGCNFMKTPPKTKGKASRQPTLPHFTSAYPMEHSH